MASANSTINITELDFDLIKNSSTGGICSSVTIKIYRIQGKNFTTDLTE